MTRYYTNGNGKVEELVLTDSDLSVKAEVERIYNEKPTKDANALANRVQDYYYNTVGISSNRLWVVIDYYCEELIGE